MKTKVLSLLVAGGLLAAAAWLGNTWYVVQADVPEAYRETVQKGLGYLAGKQFTDGHWEGDGGAHPVAMTGLVGLAFLMERERQDYRFGKRLIDSKVDDKHAATIRKAADWLIEQGQAKHDGLIFSDHASETSRYMQGHGLAVIFLAGVCANERDEARRKKLTEVLTRAVKYIADAQSTQGGWHDTSKVEGHDFANVQATAIQVQALQAAENAGISSPTEALLDGDQFLQMSLEKGVGPADMAAGLTCLPSGFAPAGSAPAEKKWFKDCRLRIPVGRDVKLGRDELAHYWFAQAEHRLGGATWTAYRTAMFDRLRESQNKDGSWPAGEGTCVGQVYSTAVWCIVLQLGNNSHPSREIEPIISN